MEFADLVAALDSPLCETLAPELFALKSTVVAKLKPFERGCQPCQYNRKQRVIAELHLLLMNTASDPAIAALLPNLIATGKASA